MKKIIFALLYSSLCLMTFGQSTAKSDKSLDIDKLLMAGPFENKMPVFANTKNIRNNTFDNKELLKSSFSNISALRPQDKRRLRLSDKSESVWKLAEADVNKTFILPQRKQGDYSVYLFATYINTDRWMNLQLEIETPHICELFVNGSMVASKYKAEKEGDKIEKLSQDVKIERGVHLLILKVLTETAQPNDVRLKWKLVPKSKATADNIQLSLTPKKYYSMNDLLYGVRVTDVSISDKGDYYLLGFTEVDENNESRSWRELYNYDNNKLISIFRGTALTDFKWVPNSNSLSYKEGNRIRVFDPDKGTERLVLPETKSLGSYFWSPDASFIVFTIADRPAEDKSGFKKLEGMPDRQASWRQRTQLYRLDIASSNTQQLTFGRLAASFHDISPDGRYLIYSTSEPDYQNRPYSRQIVYRLDLQSMKADSLWMSGNASSVFFWGDADRLIVHGGPSTFGKAGENLTNFKIANNYDRQLYLYEIASKKISPLTLRFNPSVGNLVHYSESDKLLLLANDKDYMRLYRYAHGDARFSLLNLGVDMVRSFSADASMTRAVYIGSGTNEHPKAYRFDMKAMKYMVIANPQRSKYDGIVKGEVRDFLFVSSEGKNIDGRIYLPPDFDEKKKYPMIVYYYAGTNPVSRDFGGRYPKEVYAAHGYVVYVLQPSGATGWGQDFSAAHVNNWGKTVAAEIIEGTEKVLAAHSFIDPKRIGCIGASYGGFMTMYLITQTNMFAAAVSHAGISSISSYWGEGYWGYLYSSQASADAFPWSHKDLYVNQSPLFNADKVKTPLLLLHGMDDTNVPPGESIQFYTALKLLNKDVELIQLDGQNHQIVDTQKRLQWTNSILAYFDKYLKAQSEWWQHIYPPTNF